MTTFTKFSRSVGKAERKRKKKFSRQLGRSLKKRKTGRRSIFDL